MDKLLERFIKYVKIDTQSDEESKSNPSTEKQFDLGRLLEKELKELGFENVNLDENCNLWAELKSNTDKDVPSIGFIAHMDTATDVTGKDVKPQIIKNYKGKDIVLNEDNDIVLKTEDFPELKNYKGQTLITTDGTTLLGADNKAGIAEIITALEYFIENPEVKHGDIKIAFTPDEEVGRGTETFDVEKFKTDFAYTIDGGEIGGLEYETFNAAKAKLTIKGKNVHPGTAKNTMVNSLRLGFEFNSLLPSNEKPEYTEGYEGFYHLIETEGNVEETVMKYIIRDHDMEKFQEMKDLFAKTVDYLNYKYDNRITLDMEDQYNNMSEKIKPVFHIVETAKKAMEDLGIEPKISPVRGGTDGARLSYMGLPTPNVFTGGHNFHGKYEYIPLESMEKAVLVIRKIVELYSK
ncbi:MAG: peptidase T [Tissierellales bacterium]|nr:peptidase T [Tissierellales bacterium]